jgi:hypothetical protein
VDGGGGEFSAAASCGRATVTRKVFHQRSVFAFGQRRFERAKARELSASFTSCRSRRRATPLAITDEQQLRIAVNFEINAGIV